MKSDPDKSEREKDETQASNDLPNVKDFQYKELIKNYFQPDLNQFLVKRKNTQYGNIYKRREIKEILHYMKKENNPKTRHPKARSKSRKNSRVLLGERSNKELLVEAYKKTRIKSSR